jgi:CHRD domain/PEP-CTERM motif
MKSLLLSLAFTLVATATQAAIISYDLTGTAGAGLRFGNEPAVLSGGTGGEIGLGITFDNVANLLTISNVGWGSAASAGFSDLTSTATASHIHGPTPSNNGNGFTESGAGVLFTLTRSSSATTGGTFTNAPILLTAAQATDLSNGKYYINIHTSNNGGGELRGFLVPAPVPEPTTPLLGVLALGSVALRRRRA